MADLLSPGARTWLVEALADLLAREGAATFLEARILEPTARDFPDPFTPDEAGVRALLARILTHAGLSHLGVELETFSQPDEVLALDERGEARRTGHEGAAAWFAGIVDGACRFGVAVERIAQPETLVATLCHEVAHAWRHARGVCVEDRELEEPLTDLTTVYLGFGLLTTNGAYLYRSGGEDAGIRSYTRWSHARAGYLAPEAMSFLLAAQVKCRGLGWLARRRLVGRLEANQASYFAWAWRALGDADALRQVLGIADGAAALTPAAGS